MKRSRDRAESRPAPQAGPGRSIEINADLGEGFGAYPAPAQVWRSDFERGGPLAPEETAGTRSIDAYLGLVSAVNLACGFHAGDPLLIKGYVAAAVANSCAIGAHVSFPDLAGFGNRFMELAPDDLKAVVQYQIGALSGLTAIHGATVTHVKAHGALYNRSMDDTALARALAEAVAEYDDTLPIYGLPGSALEEAAAAVGVPFRREAFSDRAYHVTGRLVDRAHAGAMILDPVAVAERVVAMTCRGTVMTLEGRSIRLDPQTLCFHADSPGALSLLRAGVAALRDAGVALVRVD